MFIKKAVFSLLVFLISFSGLVAQPIPNVYQKAQNHYHKGNYDEALETALQGLRIVKEEEGLESEVYYQGLRLISLITYSSALYEKGIDYAFQEVELRKRLHKSPKKTDAEALFNLSLFQLKLNQLKAAEASINKGLTIYKLGMYEADEVYYRLQLHLARISIQSGDVQKGDSILSTTLSDLEDDSQFSSLQGVAYYLKYKAKAYSNSEDALPYLENAYFLLNQAEVRQTNAEEFSQVIEALANHYQEKLNLHKARELYLQLHDLFDSKVLRDSLRWSGVLNNLGVLTVKTDPVAASEWLAKSFQLQKQLTGLQDNAFWSSLDNYAMSLHRQAHSEEALALYREYSTQLNPDQYICSAYATAMNNQAMILRNEGLIQEALDCLYRAERLSQKKESELKEKDRLKLSTLYYNLAQTHQSLSHYDTAIYYYKKSTDESKIANAMMSSEYLAAINGMASLYHDIGYYTEAEIFYTEALRIQESLAGAQTNVYASILSNYALLKQDKGAYEEALDFFEQALEIKRKLLGLDHPDYIAVLANIGLLYLEQTNYEQSRRMLVAVVVKYENIYGKNHPRLANSLTNLARLEIALGNYPEAEPLLKEALRIKKKAFGLDHSSYAVTAVEMANFYMLLGNYEAAMPLLEQSRNLLLKKYGKTHPSYATATQNMAILAEARGEVQVAEAYLLETLEIDERTLGKQNPKYAVTLNNLASFYQKNDSLEKAMPILQEALNICKNILEKNNPLYTSTLLNLALLYQDRQQFDKAEPLIEEVVQMRAKLLGDRHPDYAYALYGQAVNAYRLEDYQLAMQLFQQVIELYAWQIREYFPALSEKEKSAFYQRIEPVLNTYRDFVINVYLSDTEVLSKDKDTLVGSLYDIQLLTKAMLLDASNKIRRSIFSSGDPQLINLYERWHELKEQLAKYYALSAQELLGRNIHLQDLENKANELEKELSSQSVVFARNLAKQEYKWQDIQEKLSESEAAIEIIRVKNEASQQVFYTALVLDSLNAAPKLVILPRGKEMEGKNFNYYKNAIAYRMEDELSYDLFWQPIREALSTGIHTVYLAPDGVYNKISLNSLYNKREKTFLLDEINIRRLSSTRDFLKIESTEERLGGQPLAFLVGYPNYTSANDDDKSAKVASANYSSELLQPEKSFQLEVGGYDFQPLPGTQNEVNFIESLMEEAGWQIEKLTGADASEEKLKHMLIPNVLHVATHGYFLSDLPNNRDQKTFGIHMQNVEANPLLRSGLLLAGAATRQSSEDSLYLEAEDGVLTAYEAMNLNLNGTELVVLSACETALGEVKNGEGVYGLQRAFLVAGAKSVLMSLWKVNDESTTELIRLFYDNWLSGQDKFSALSNAQRSIRDKYEEPYHWAPFVLIGS